MVHRGHQHFCEWPPRELAPPAPQVLIAILTVVSLAAARWFPSLRAWVDRVDIRVLVALHLTRLIAGISFLVLGVHDELPQAFALPAGYGDIAVGLAAIALMVCVRPDAPAASRWYQVWNLFGFADILMVVCNAARVGLAAPASMAPLLRPPLGLLPSFLVPLIITTHVLLFVRLRASARRTDAQ